MFGLGARNVSALQKDNSAPWYKSGALALNGVLPSLIHKYDAGQYYNTATGPTAFPFANTRTTNAMHYDSQGRLVWAPANMYIRSNDMAHASWSKNTMTLTETADASPSGDKVYKHVVNNATSTIGNDAAGGFWQQITVLGGSYVTFSFYAKASEVTSVRIREQVTTGARDKIDLLTGIVTHELGAVYPIVTQDVGDGWWRISIKYLVNAGATLSNFAIKGGNDTGDGVSGFLVSSVQHEMSDVSSPKAYISTGTSAAAFYGQRFDYNPATLAPRGALIESTATNLVPVSLNMAPSNVAVLQSAVSVSPTSYLGNWAAVRVTADGTSSSHGAYPTSYNPTANSTVSLQAIVAPISGSTFYQLTGSGNWLLNLNGYANFDLTGSGSVTQTGSSANNAFVQHLGNGVYHIGVNVTTSAVPASGAACIVGYIPNGTSIRLPVSVTSAVFDFIYGGVFQSFTGWCSVTPTFGVAATRASDLLNLNISTWLDQTKGTLLVNFTRSYVASGSGNTQTFAALVETASTVLLWTSGFGSHASHRFDDVVATVAQAQLTTTGTATAYATRKMVAAYAANDFKAVENGGTVQTDVAGTVPTAVTSLQVGSVNNSNFVNGWIREVRYYADNSASGAQLQALTT